MHKRHPPPNKDISISKCQACWGWETLVQKEEGYPEDRLSALPDFGAVYCPEAENVAFIFKTENATIGFSVILTQDTCGATCFIFMSKITISTFKIIFNNIFVCNIDQFSNS